MARDSYVLVVYCPGDVVVRTRARVFEVARGRYLYVGSCGAGCHRVLRHLGRGEKRLFWHIDYLLEYCVPERVLVLRGVGEEALAYVMDRVMGLEPVEGFGSSDNPAARSHLFRALGDVEGLLEEILAIIETLRGGGLVEII